MTEPSSLLTRTVEAATDLRVRANTLGMDIDSDRLRYSNWLSALATAGVALVLTNFEKLLSPYLSHYLSPAIVPLLAASIFVSSLCLGGYVHWKVSKEAMRQRQRVMLYLLQRSRVLSELVEVTNAKDLFSDLLAGRLLSTNDQRRLEVSEKPEISDLAIERLILGEAILVILGFVVALVGATRGLW